MEPLFRMCWKLQTGVANLEALWSFVQSRLVGSDVEAAEKVLVQRLNQAWRPQCKEDSRKVLGMWGQTPSDLF